jgi:transposase
MSLSPYSGLYDIVVAEDHLLRKIKYNIDFSFVNPMLRRQYSEKYGRPAKEPEMMFKLMFLKKLYDLSDERLISQARTDMAVKYFLDLDPEAGMIDPSLMTKFRKTRITEDILEEMLRETIRQAIEKGIVKSKTIIVDSTHTLAAVRPKTVTQVLRELSKQLRREIYQTLYDLSSSFPEKPSETAELEDEIEYTCRLLEATAQGIESSDNQGLKDLHARIKGLLDSDKIREIRSKDDEDARFGRKTQASSFFGYKNHLAMTEERLISAVEVTGGGRYDVNYLVALSEKSKHNGIDVKEIIGDRAYVSSGNLDYCDEMGISLIALTNPAVAATAEPKDDGFQFNKDANAMQCPAGELSTTLHKKKAEKGSSTYLTYRFSRKKCNVCPQKDKCAAFRKTMSYYSVVLLSDKMQERLEFEKSEAFSKRLEIRSRIEEKNGELKQAHGLRRADSTGLQAMRLQAYFTAFAVNVKRIVKLVTPIPSFGSFLPHCFSFRGPVFLRFASFGTA